MVSFRTDYFNARTFIAANPLFWYRPFCARDVFVMKEYPSIPGSSRAPREFCYGFTKYDGSSLRAEWSKKRGWYKFGTRYCMNDESDPIFGRGFTLFKEKYGDDLVKVFEKEKLFRGVKSVVVFFEFFGSKSFAGMHFPDETQWDVVPFDVNPIGKDILGPKDFLDNFGHLKIAEHIYTGNLNEELIEQVRKEKIDLESKYPIKTAIPEGMVVKGGNRHNRWMSKIKTERYREELKKRYQMDWERMWE
jgi:hypothetical protein